MRQQPPRIDLSSQFLEDLALDVLRLINMKISGSPALILILFALVRCSLQQCYNMDGSIAAHHIPCTEFASASDALVPCCEPGRTCLPNGMCSSSESDPTLERESCTDSTWKSDNCPRFCGQGKLSQKSLRNPNLISIQTIRIPQYLIVPK